MSRVNYLQEVATKKELLEASPSLSKVYLAIFDKVSADMFNDLAPFTLERLAPIVESLREMLATRSLDAGNVVMNPPPMPPLTPFKKFNDPLDVR